MKLITFLIPLLLVNVIAANNCQQFLTMQGKGQEMSIMLCITDNPPELSNTDMNVSLLNLSNHTNDTYFYNNSIETNSTSNHTSSNTTEDIIDLDSPDEQNITTTTELEEEPTTIDPTTEPIENITTTEPPTEPEDNTSTTTESPIEISTTPLENLRGTEKNTTNNSKSIPITINEQKLEGAMIVIIIICCIITLASVLGFIRMYCKYKKESILPENEPKIKKIKRRRVSPELPKDLMIEKITDGLQYTNKYRNSSNFKRASTTLSAVNRLEKARKERAKKGPFPPKMRPPRNPPPNLPPPAPSVAMEHVKTMLERKNRNSWSIKEVPTNTNNITHQISVKNDEDPSDEIVKTNASNNLA